MVDVSNVSNNQNNPFEVSQTPDAEIDELQKSRLLKKEVETGKGTEISAEAKISNEEFEKLEQLIGKLMEKPPSNSSVLNRVMRLLTELLPIMQNLAAAQAKQLDLPTRMQTLYTELIAKAPLYTKAQIDNDSERSEKNNQVGIWTDRLRSYRDVWTDLAKKTQSNINTTNEAVNQQVDLLTTFLQQLRELVSLMTR